MLPEVGQRSPKAFYKCACEVRFLRHLSGELGQPQPGTIQRCDNEAALRFVENQVQHSRLRHIDIKYFVVRDWVAAGDIVPEKVATSLNVADIFTKILDRMLFLRFRDMLLYRPSIRKF